MMYLYIQIPTTEECLAYVTNKTLTKTNKIKNIIKSYKKMESFLISNERNRSHIAGLWFECLISLNNKIN